MRTRLLAAVLGLALAGPVLAADPFPGLKSLGLPGYLSGTIHYDPSITKVINQPLNPGSPEYEAIPTTRVLETKLDRGSDEVWVVDYTEGPSDDPEFRFLKKGEIEEAGSVQGLELWLPGTGAAYVSGHADTMFDTRRKLVAKAGKIVEVPQPYYFVGVEGKAKKDVVLFTRKGGKEILARIPKGNPLSVLLAEGDEWYLARTAFGLVGWLQVPVAQEAEVVEGLFFRGD
jgi:hypothetical protein